MQRKASRTEGGTCSGRRVGRRVGSGACLGTRGHFCRYHDVVYAIDYKAFVDRRRFARICRQFLTKFLGRTRTTTADTYDRPTARPPDHQPFYCGGPRRCLAEVGACCAGLLISRQTDQLYGAGAILNGVCEETWICDQPKESCKVSSTTVYATTTAADDSCL